MILQVRMLYPLPDLIFESGKPNMKTSGLSFLVVGAGAVGGITAAILKKEGYDVEIVCKHDDYAKQISNKGLEISGVCGSFRVTMSAWSLASMVREKKDIVLLATKATDMIEAAKSILPVLKSEGYLVSFQNGLCEDDLASVVGRSRVIGCVVGWGATMEEKGRLIMSSGGDFILGYTDRDPDDFLKSLAEILSAVVPARTTNNIAGHRYSKLIINSCITTLGALCGLYLGEMLSLPKVRRIFIEIIREAIEVAEKMKIKVEIFGGRLDFYKFLKKKSAIGSLKRHLLIRIIGYKYRKLKSSNLQSLKRGKLTEIDYLNGYIVKNGKDLNVPVPVNTVVVDMIHEIEKGRRKITQQNFNDPIFDRFN
jgi:2-dehydropantoate 2-reductase